MMNNRLTLIIGLLGFLLTIKPSYADVEAIQQVQGVLRTGQENIGFVQEQYAVIQETQRSVSEGIGNAAKTVSSIKEDPLGGTEELLNQTNSEITNVNNIGKATGQVEKSYNSQTGKGNDVEVADTQQEKMMAIQRENLANLYAVAFTTRAFLAKAREINEPKNDMKDTRELVKLTNQKALEMLKRARNIMKIETATFEFMASQQAMAYSVQENADKKKPEGGGK